MLLDDEQSQRKKTERLFMTATVINLIAYTVPFISSICHMYGTVMHELGHTFTAWLFGHPAIPSFNFLYGHGVTLSFSRPWLLTGLFLAGFVFVYYRRFKLNSDSISLASLFFGALYLLTFFFPVLFNSLKSFMGHGGEIIAAFCCCYLGLSPYVQRPAHEKNVLFVLGVYLFIGIFYFVYRLHFDNDFIWLYLNPMDSGMENDLVRLAETTKLSMKFWQFLLLALNTLAIFLLVKALRYPANIFSAPFEHIKAIFRIRRTEDEVEE